MKTAPQIRKYILALTMLLAFVGLANAQGVKRIIVIKVDGLPPYFVDQFVKQRDPETGKSVLPWFDEIFYKNGTRVPNFYSRGMSLSGPAWGQIDTGQHLQIKGNVEYDRYTLRAYDYLGVIPFYTSAAFKKKVDMPAVEVLDQLHLPLLVDIFPYEQRYTANQLYQRGISWEALGSGFVNLYPGSPKDLIDEWTMGIDFRNATVDQNERDIIGKVSKRPEVNYYDYYDGNFDHVSHHNSDTGSRLAVLKHLDRTIGRIWLAVQASSRADETAMVVVSDHGFNSEAGVYSQGFNLVKVLASAAGGGHHVVTKRRLMLDYSIKGIDPFVPLIKTASKDSYYLQGQNESYPTALLDFDGNERSSIHLRNSSLNILHILFQQLKRDSLSATERKAVVHAVFNVIDQHREQWKQTLVEMTDELGALHRWNEAQAKVVAALPDKFSDDDIARGIDKRARRTKVLAQLGREDEVAYGRYLAMLNNLLSLQRDGFDGRRISIEDIIAPGSMGDLNSLYELQNYVVGLSQKGLVVDERGDLDLQKSFARVNYFDLLESQTVRNNVQAKLGNRPIDFVAGRVPAAALPSDLRSNEDAIWLYGGSDKQALILSRTDADGGQSYRYIPVAGLRQDPDGQVVFQPRDLGPGFPLKMYEDADFAIPQDRRAAWVNSWHTELEWLRAAHRSMYSDAIIALNEQLDRHPLPDDGSVSDDDRLIRRFRERQRHLTEADLLILANNHWNFDVRGFNPGGNHGSFFRVSTNSTFMLAGGSKTGIPRGLAVDEPYDSLSVMPTILALMGRIDGQNQPDSQLLSLGFSRFPGRVIKEALGR